jgi:guanosine-3',5'-bis(diphosphate) 3'-pyrophosphohydrolase
MIRQMELVEKIRAYDPDADEDALNRAYVFSMQKHGSQKRASGDPYFSHPVEVAYKLTQYKLDTASIITALLHDTVEDTDATLDEIEQLFGMEIRNLVDGVTKLNRLEIKSESSKQAENFRKLVIAMASDLRVLMVKLADRLHNMETLHHIPKPEKRQRIARETLEIYAALAERIGMRRMKEELQDLAFKELFPEARESILKRLEFLRTQGKTQVQRVEEILKELAASGGLDTVRIYGREKKPYSIWKKMESKGVTFEQLADIVGFRIITQDVQQCYHVLGLIHEKYHTIPGHFKDYISTPKNNGYQSIHTAVIGPQQQRIEMQIRTEEMHEIAEYGIAAHWGYKQGAEKGQVSTDGKQYRWVRELLEIMEQSDGAEEFLEHTKLEMYHDQVFSFTPKGDIIALPRGSTPVDFAYAVHSGVGFTCVGAKVNGRIVPLKHALKNGDQVEIITAKTQTPSPSWERFVVTGKAKSEIRRYIRDQQHEEYVTLGRAILSKTFKQEGHDISEKMLEPALALFKKKHANDLYAEVGEGIINRNQVYDAVFHTTKSESHGVKNPFDIITKKKQKKSVPMPIKGLVPGMAIHYAGCCHPIPGDKIVGIVATGKGITIHTMDCDTLENFADSPEKWIDVAWDSSGQDDLYIGRLRVSLSHETAALASVANVIAKDEGNISNLKITNRSTDFFDLLIDVEVKNARHLNNIIASLRAKSVVQSVERG